jgi:hypothetical protein
MYSTAKKKRKKFRITTSQLVGWSSIAYLWRTSFRDKLSQVSVPTAPTAKEFRDFYSFFEKRGANYIYIQHSP